MVYGPACWGYRLWDEPPGKMFGDLAERLAELRKVRPGRVFQTILHAAISAGHGNFSRQRDSMS